MGTKDFNQLDLFICRWRSRQLRKHVKANSEVLDFGCGHQALFLQSLKDHIRRGIGVDYDAPDARPAANLEILNFHFTDRLEFPDASFDQITMLAVIEHLPLEIRRPLFTEFHRVLRKGGRVLMTTPTPAAKPLLEFLAFKLGIISQPEIADHKHYYNRSDLDQLATETGFSMSHYSTFQFGFNSLAVYDRDAR